MQNLTYTFVVVLILSTMGTLYAQEVSFKGNVRDEKSKTIAAATISLLKQDSSWLQSEITDDNGNFTLKHVIPGKYILAVNATGFKALLQVVDIQEGSGIQNLVMIANTTLQEVILTNKAPQIESVLGKTIVNLEQATTISGSSVLDLLRKSPGVTVEGSAINLRGVSALVLVDDKQTYMTGDQLADYLKSLPAEQVAQLEIITQPSAKYDAEGSGGIINIKTRKLRKKGYNGNLTLNAAQNVYPNSHNSAAFNYRNNKWCVYTNAGYLYGNGFVNRVDNRQATNEQTGQIVTATNQTAFRHEVFKDYNLKVGADYSVNDKMTIGCSAKGIYHPNDENDVTNTVVNDAVGIVLYNNTTNAMTFRRNHYIGNAYAKYKLSEKQEISVDADYFYRYQRDRQNVINDNYDAQQHPVAGGQRLKSYSPSAVDAMVIKADYTGEIAKSFALEAGVKSSFANADNGAFFEREDNGVWKSDSTRTNEFIYKENINAGYANASKDFGEKWKSQLGLRAENAIIYGHELMQGNTFTRSSTALFPTAVISYTLTGKHSFELSCGRRINRPSYTEMNPFVMVFSQYFYHKGNPDLKPSFRNYIELKYNYNNVLFASVGYRTIKGYITPVVKYDAATKATYATWGNYANRKVVAGSLSYNEQLFKNWLIGASFDGYYNEFYDVNGNALLAKSLSCSFDLNSQFTFGSGWGVDTSFSFATGDLQNLIDRYGSRVWMDVGVHKKIWNDSATIKLGFNDPFRVYRIGTTTDYNGIRSVTAMNFGTQEVTLGFTYSFGKRMENIRQQRQSNSEEAGRM